MAITGMDVGVAVEKMMEVIVLVTVDTVNVVWRLVIPSVVMVLVIGHVVT